MQTPTPISRDTLRGLRAKIEEETRLERVRSFIQSIYQQAINVAKTTSDTAFNFPIPSSYLDRRASDTFFLVNMSDILSGLQTLFPDCTVSHSILCKGTDGKFYDISKLDDRVLPFVNRALDQSFIVIDWS